MPREGFSSITVGDSVYLFWKDWFDARKNNLSVKGIRSLSALVSVILYNLCTDNKDKAAEVLSTPEDTASSLSLSTSSCGSF